MGGDFGSAGDSPLDPVDESLAARLNEKPHIRDLRPPHSSSPRYGVTRAQRLSRQGRHSEDDVIPLAPRDKMVDRGKLEQRRKLVAENFVSGLSPSQIAQALDVPAHIVSDDLKVIIGRWKREQADVVEPHILKIVQRCERMINSVWTRALNGDPVAQEQVRKNQQQIMRALGIGLPKTEGEQRSGDGNALIPLGGGNVVNVQQFNTLVLKSAKELHDDELALVAQMKLIEQEQSNGIRIPRRAKEQPVRVDGAGPDDDAGGRLDMGEHSIGGKWGRGDSSDDRADRRGGDEFDGRAVGEWDSSASDGRADADGDAAP